MTREIIPRIRLSSLAANYLARRNPWVPVWWSVALPGFGHLYMGECLKGLILMSWEILVNDQAHLNQAITLTLLGDTERAKAVVHPQWLMIYPLFYIFTMFDAYRTCVELNLLAESERLQSQRRFDRVVSSAWGTQQLTRRNPIMAAIWSCAVSGFGQLYIDRGLKAVILMVWYLVVVLKSGLAMAAYHSILGEFSLASENLDFQWLLFWPSIYIFGIADAYADTVEQNRVVCTAFRYRMRKYLRNGTK